MARTTSITEAIVSLIQTVEDVVRRFGDRLERGDGSAEAAGEASMPRRARLRAPRVPATEGDAPASGARASRPPKAQAKSKKLRSALKSHWANMTPEERAARIAKMQAGRTKGKPRAAAAKRRKASPRRTRPAAAPTGQEIGNG